MTTGTIFTFGANSYPNEADGITYLATLAAQHAPLYLVDIRSRPSRGPITWQQNSLRNRWGYYYLWVTDLCDSNYGTGLPPCLAYPERGVRSLARRLRVGQNLLLFCACADSAVCHRMLVAKLLQEALSESGVKQ